MNNQPERLVREEVVFCCSACALSQVPGALFFPKREPCWIFLRCQIRERADPGFASAPACLLLAFTQHARWCREKVVFSLEAGTEQATLDVHITAPGFAIQEWRKQMILPVNGDSKEITFILFPVQEGEQAVEIEFFHGSSRVGYVLVKTEVSVWAFTQKPTRVTSMEDPVDGLKNKVGTSPSRERRILHVSWIEREAKLYYTIYSDDPNEHGEWEKSGPHLKAEIADYLQNLNAFLTEIVSQGNPAEDVWESICLNLQSIGQHLFTTLIPPAIAERAKQWKQGSSVIVSANEQWIPWELMFDEQDFWGKKYIIARDPRLPDRHKVPDVNRPESRIAKQIRKIVNVVGGNVLPPSLAQQAAQLFNTLPPSLVTLLQEKPLAALQQALPGTDALHCTCHGLLKPHLLQIAKESSLSVNILPETVEKLLLEPSILVFVNACASTAPVITFGKFSSFGWEFYRRGARTFVGTLGAVPVKYAISFAEAVYRELFRKDAKQTIGQAVALAKEAAAKDRNLFWLFYCIYGDPDYSVEGPDPDYPIETTIIEEGKDNVSSSIRDGN